MNIKNNSNYKKHRIIRKFIFLIVLAPFTIIANTNNNYSSGPLKLQYKFDKSTNNSNYFTNYPERQEWIWADLGFRIGSGILDSADFNGDGEIELIISGVGPSDPPGTAAVFHSIYILKDDLITVNCILAIEDPVLDYHIQQLDQDVALEIILLTEFQIIAMDGNDCLIQSQFSFPQAVTAAAIGDVNNDNIPDIVYSNGNDLYVSKWNDPSSREEFIGMGGDKIIVESLGRQGGDDIGVQLDDLSLQLIQGDSLQLIRNIANAGREFAFGNIDNQGQYEIIATTDSSNLAIYDLQTGNVIQLLNFSFQNSFFIKTKDLDSNGHEEILVGYYNGPGYIVFNEFGNIIQDIDIRNRGVFNLHITDFGKGLGNKLLISGGKGSTATDILYKIDLATELVEWESTNLFGPYQLGSMGEYYANNQEYLAVSFHNSGETFDTGGVAFLDVSTGNLNSIITPVESAITGRVTGIAMANIDNDPQWELCIAYSLHIPRYIECRDSVTQEIQWKRDLVNNFGVDVYYFDIFDIDDDSELDLIIVDSAGFVRVYNASNGFLKWQSVDLTDNSLSWGFNSVSLIDNHLWVSFPWGEIFTLDVFTGLTVNHHEDTFITQIISDGITVYATKEGEGLGVLDPSTLELSEVLYPTTDSLTYLDISDDNELFLIASGSIPRLKPILVSTNNKFDPWQLGNTRIYDTHMPNKETLFIATTHGAEKLDLSNIYPIFKNGFEK